MTFTSNPAAKQLRAPKGGAYGANGAWYEGGKFIATTEHPKVPSIGQKSTKKVEVFPFEWIQGIEGYATIYSKISSFVEFARDEDGRVIPGPVKPSARAVDGFYRMYGADRADTMVEDLQTFVTLYNLGKRFYRETETGYRAI